MSQLCTLILTMILILNSIDSSSLLDCSRNTEPIPGGSSRESSLLEEYCPERTITPASPSLRIRSRSPPAGHSSRARSKSPPGRHPAFVALRYELEELSLIRLIPYKYPQKVFIIRKYTFPADKQLELRGNYGASVTMPTRERTVLATSTGDVMAIFDRNNAVLRGIYTRIDNVARRSKINMRSGEIKLLNQDELDATPLGNNKHVSQHFKILYVDEM